MEIIGNISKALAIIVPIIMVVTAIIFIIYWAITVGVWEGLGFLVLIGIMSVFVLPTTAGLFYGFGKMLSN